MNEAAFYFNESRCGLYAMPTFVLKLHVQATATLYYSVYVELKVNYLNQLNIFYLMDRSLSFRDGQVLLSKHDFLWPTFLTCQPTKQSRSTN